MRQAERFTPRLRGIFVAAVAALSMGGAPLSYGATETDSGATSIEVPFAKRVANIELDSNELISTQPKEIRGVPRDAPGVLWFGRIVRRLTGTPLGRTGLPRMADVPFATCYRGSVPIALWCDLNLNHDLTDDPPIPLNDFVEPKGAKSALVDLQWTAMRGEDRLPIQWKVRIVLEPLVESPPRFRIQMVYAMVGTLAVDGTPRRAFLYDGNRDGLFSMDYGDGIFVDEDGDGNVLVDPADRDFIPFGASAQIGGTTYQTTRITLDGTSISMETRSGQLPLRRLTLGEEAPDFQFDGLDGKPIRLSAYRGRPVLVYFWASWCGACYEMAPALHSLYERFHPQGLEILAISFDRDRQPVLDFIKSRDERWPVSYLGRGFWENPIGRLYGASVAGYGYLVDRNGKFVGAYGDLDKLSHDLPVFLLGSGVNSLPPLIPVSTNSR